MKKNDSRSKSSNQPERKPYPHNITRNKELLNKLLEGYKYGGAALTAATIKGQTVLVATVTLTLGDKTETMKVPAMDTPEGRRANYEATHPQEAKPVNKKVRVGKTERERKAGVLSRHEQNKNKRADTNKSNSRGGTGAGAMKGTDSAKGASLGKGKTK